VTWNSEGWGGMYKSNTAIWTRAHAPRSRLLWEINITKWSDKQGTTTITTRLDAALYWIRVADQKGGTPQFARWGKRTFLCNFLQYMASGITLFMSEVNSTSSSIAQGNGQFCSVAQCPKHWGLVQDNVRVQKMFMSFILVNWFQPRLFVLLVYCLSVSSTRWEWTSFREVGPRRYVALRRCCLFFDG